MALSSTDPLKNRKAGKLYGSSTNLSGSPQSVQRVSMMTSVMNIAAMPSNVPGGVGEPGHAVRGDAVGRRCTGDWTGNRDLAGAWIGKHGLPEPRVGDSDARIVGSDT